MEIWFDRYWFSTSFEDNNRPWKMCSWIVPRNGASWNEKIEVSFSWKFLWELEWNGRPRTLSTGPHDTLVNISKRILNGRSCTKDLQWERYLAAEKIGAIVYSYERMKIRNDVDRPSRLKDQAAQNDGTSAVHMDTELACWNFRMQERNWTDTRMENLW